MSKDEKRDPELLALEEEQQRELEEEQQREMTFLLERRRERTNPAPSHEPKDDKSPMLRIRREIERRKQEDAECDALLRELEREEQDLRRKFAFKT